MKLHLIAVGQRLPAWIQQGFEEFNKRLPNEFKLHLCEISTAKRKKNAETNYLREQEGQWLLKAVPKHAKIVALAVDGDAWSTHQLVNRLTNWALNGEEIAFLIGGPDGLSDACINRAAVQLALSNFTLPHGLARIVLVEQIYRAWSIMQGHPYHR